MNIPISPSDFKPVVELTPEQDAKLIANGYEPLAVLGKVPVANGWQTDPVTPGRIAEQRASHPDAKSTGLRTGTLSGIDIDLRPKEHVKKIVELAKTLLGQTSLGRVGSKGILLCYRSETPIGKITIKTKDAKIEILGIGQQFVAFGIHPDTGKPYRWIKRDPDFGDVFDPLSIPLANLPLVTPDQLRDFARQAQSLLTELGYGPATVTGDTGEVRKPSQSTDAPVYASTLIEAAAFVDPFTDRDEWRNNVAAIRAANIQGDDDLSIRRQIAHDWSSGQLDKFGRFKDTEGKYTGPEAVDAVFDSMEPKDNGISIATFFENARKGRWKGNPFSGRACEVFKNAIARSEAPANGSLQFDGLTVQSLDTIKAKKIKWLWPGRIPLGMLTLIAGEPDDGKSQILANISATVSTGGKWPFLGGEAEQGAVLWIAAEDPVQEVTKPRLIAAGANPVRIHIIGSTVKAGEENRNLSIQADCARIEQAIRHLHTAGQTVKLIVVDPISAYMGQGDTWKNSDVRAALVPLCELAAKYNVAVIGITHFGKSQHRRVLDRVLDSKAFPAVARATFLTFKERSDDGNETGRRLFLKGKFNIGPEPAGLAYRIEGVKIPDPEGGFIDAPRIVWDAIVTTTAEEADAQGDSKSKDSKLEKAMLFLESILADGPLEGHEVGKRRRKAKISEGTLRRAQAKLGIKPRRPEGSDARDNTRIWELPPDTGAAEE